MEQHDQRADREGGREAFVLQRLRDQGREDVPEDDPEDAPIRAVMTAP